MMGLFLEALFEILSLAGEQLVLLTEKFLALLPEALKKEIIAPPL